MAKILNKNILSTIFFTSIIILNLPYMITSDDVCPYPCYPPPTGTGTGGGSATPSPPSTTLTPPSQSGSYSPPTGYYNPPPSSSNLPYSPPFVNNFNSPPPPDPILPYFPFYYRKPPHSTGDQSSSATTLGKSTVMISMTMTMIGFFHFVLLSV